MPEDELDIPIENINLDNDNAFLKTIEFDDGDKLNYIYIREDKINGEFRKVLDTDIVFEDNENGEEEPYVTMMWIKPTDDDTLKKYSVNDHWVYAGCQHGDVNVENGKLMCEQKDIYIVQHPFDEYADFHYEEN